MEEETQKEIKVIIQPGFRFYPTEEELVSFYLHKKLEQKRKPELDRVIPVINIYDFEPWMLPKVSGELCSGDTEQWFFFVPRQEREARGGRPNRTTASGYWKATGSPSYVYSSNNRVIGVKKSMVFYRGRAPTGKKTTWKMNEYRAIEEEMLPSTSSPQSIPKVHCYSRYILIIIHFLFLQLLYIYIYHLCMLNQIKSNKDQHMNNK